MTQDYSSILLDKDTPFPLLAYAVYQIQATQASEVLFLQRGRKTPYSFTMYANQVVNVQGRVISKMRLVSGEVEILPGVEFLTPFNIEAQNVNIGSMPGLTVDTWNAGSIDINSITAGSITIVGNSQDTVIPESISGSPYATVSAGGSWELSAITPASGHKYILDSLEIGFYAFCSTNEYWTLLVYLKHNTSDTEFTWTLAKDNTSTAGDLVSLEAVFDSLPDPGNFSPGTNMYWAGEQSNDEQYYHQWTRPLVLYPNYELHIAFVNNDTKVNALYEGFYSTRGRSEPL